MGNSKAHKYEATSQRTTFADVAGIDEANEELEEVVDFLKHPDRYRRLGGRDPPRRAAQRTAGDGQDAAGPGGCRRGRRAVLLDLRLGVRRDDRRRGRQPGARPVRAGQGGRSVDHLHRRARRDRALAQLRQHQRRQRRARADAQPDPHRDGRLHRQRGRDRARGHQPPRGPRLRAAAPRTLRPPDHGQPARPGRAAEDPPGAHAQRSAQGLPPTSRRSPPARREWWAPT